MPKPPLEVQDQIALLDSRGMKFHDVTKAPHFLINISYYRLKGYWWDMQTDKKAHTFADTSYFEDVIDLYNFDRKFRLIVFNTIERIEVALRTKLTYHLSLNYGTDWYTNQLLFTNPFQHAVFLSKLDRDLRSSKEEFIKNHYKNHKGEIPEAWKALEILTMGTISKLYQNLSHQLPEKNLIATEFGLNNQKYLASWLLSATYIRNIIAHHGRLWNRYIMNKFDWPKSTKYPVLSYTPNEYQRRKIFPLLSAMLYMNNIISPGHHIKDELFQLFKDFPNTPLHSMGFPKDWQKEPIWQ